jgi:hypothetical protein
MFLRPSAAVHTRRRGPHRTLLVILLTAALLLAIAASVAGSGKAAELNAKVLPAGPAPKPLPAWQRQPAGKFTGKATSSGFPTPRQLFGKAGRPDALKDLEEDRAAASDYTSIYRLHGADHLAKVTLDRQNYQDASGTWHPNQQGEGPKSEEVVRSHSTSSCAFPGA